MENLRKRLSRRKQSVFLFLLGAAICLVFSSRVVADLPVVDDVDVPVLQAHCRQLLQALSKMPEPLPRPTHIALQALLKSSSDNTAAKIQAILDTHCLVAVTINPESRVKANRGPATADLIARHEHFVFVKVINEAGVTHALTLDLPRTQGSSSSPEKGWLEADVYAPTPLPHTLSGAKVEYVLLRLKSRSVGKHEATLAFDVGQGTQDLGFRAEVPILFTVRSASR